MAGRISLQALRAMNVRRLGILGGSFDPVHVGHVELAEKAMAAQELDAVLFIPAKQNPLKSSGPVAADDLRLELLLKAMAPHPKFYVSEIELQREGVKSYTVDTLRELSRALEGRTALYLIAGMDALKDFLHWREPRKILELAAIVPVARAGMDREQMEKVVLLFREELGVELASNVIWEAPQEISSTSIRQSIAAGAEEVRGLPLECAETLRRKGVYRNAR